SIDDDKLAGKVFRIRCRRCGKSIVLRGDVGAAASAAQPEWHIVQDGEQLGPFDTSELLRRRASGQLDDESYIWREGFAEWQQLGSVKELRAISAPASVLVSAPVPAPAASAPSEPAHAQAHALFAQRGPEVGPLLGERRESSQLFTLDGLAKMA